MATEDLYSDGNTDIGPAVVIVDPSNAIGEQDGNFARGYGMSDEDRSWEFTMDDTSISVDQFASIVSMIMSWRYYHDTYPPPGTTFIVAVWDNSASDWVEIISRPWSGSGDWRMVDPGDYVENIDLTPYITTPSELNAIKFRVWASGAELDMYVDSIRIGTTLPPEPDFEGIPELPDERVAPFGDAIGQFSSLRKTFTKGGLSTTSIDDEGYITETYDSDESFVGILIPKARFDFLGHGFELRGEQILYANTKQPDWPGLAIGDHVVDQRGKSWKVVSFTNYDKDGFSKLYGVERDVK